MIPKSSIVLCTSILSLSALTACHLCPSGIKLPSEPLTLMEPCGDPALLSEGADVRDVLMAHADDVETIRTCKAKHEALSQWVANLYKEK